MKNNTCPSCGEKLKFTSTKYGTRAGCDPCGLVSWGNKALVPYEVADLRKEFHDAFDKVWRGETSLFRQKCYRFMAHNLNLTEHECHGGGQTDPEKLREMISFSKKMRKLKVKKWKDPETYHFSN